jgi:hypothetical protein
VREVYRGHRDPSDDVRRDWPLERGIGTIQGHEIEMDQHTTVRERALSLCVSAQIVINHLQHDLNTKSDHLAGASKR